MSWTILSVNWSGQALTDEQYLVLRNIAAKQLLSEQNNPVTNFRHQLCEGHVIRGKDGVYGAFSGTFFKADLGHVHGERWEVDFFLPLGSERFAVEEDSTVISTRPLDTGGVEFEIVDTSEVVQNDTQDDADDDGFVTVH